VTPARRAAAPKKATAKAVENKTAAKKATAKKATAKKATAKKAVPKPPVKETARSSGARRRAAPSALILTPGAGASRDHRTLVALEAAVRERTSIDVVERVDFPYRIAGKRAPDKAPVAIAHLVAEAEALVARTGVDPNGLILGGRSYGGRMCSMAVAEGLPAAGLVLLSYPLHPPGKPDNLRVEHFPQLDLPVLFVSGDKDPFGRPDELDEHVRAIPGPVTQVWVPGGHDPKRDPLVIDAVVDWLRSLG
jgi:predicted alpha/beta-hydrolase family hydrolase